MQSFLVYRKVRRNLEEQIQRHGLNKVAGCAPQPDTDREHPTEAGGRKEDELLPPDEGIQPRDHAAEEKELENEKPRERHENGTTLLAPPSTGLSRQTSEHRTFSANGSMHQTSTRGSSLSRATSRATSRASRPNHLSTAQTRSTIGAVLGQSLTGVEVRTRKTNEGGPERGKVFVVGYQGPDDPLNPHNWSKTKRVAITLLVASIGLIVGVASSIDSAAIPQASKEFHVSEVTESLATAIYLIGFGFGAFTAAPVSETVGRNPVYIVTMLLFMIWIMASALAPNIGAQLTFRFLAGYFGSTPLTCAGGSISDMWDPTQRTAVFPMFANAAFWGPVLGPIMGGFIAENVSWRWCEWVTLLWAGSILIAMFFFLPETYAPILLSWKAQHLRSITGNERYKSALEVQDTKFMDRLIHNFYRPFQLFVYEPIVVLFTLYLTVVYIVLFTFLTGFEYIFSDTYGLSQGLTFLIFVTLGIGFGFASAFVPRVVKRYQQKLAKVQEQGGTHLPPEQRLVFAMMGAPFLPIGLFWMAWSSRSSVSIWSPILSNLPIGFAIMCIFISSYQYLIDAFEAYAASALVGATFIRYIAAGGMIPASIPLYENLGVHWTVTLLGAISALMAPVPYIFYYFGARIRKRSRYAASV
ncbi:major facilitator superfamily domain-containing protein [Exophiala viscosa]|uniref:Major facilitator superfamily domain-containing protein n=1 Tax=Exophiala viscosa TaxID=2486360 RepID=A0AAN6IGH3_9EURO|nr:major facilitator superfamily domain-containing protein [Exophiala viscosa]